MREDPTLPACCAEALASAMRPELFKALCDPIRISIVASLATREGPCCVSDVAECCGVDFSGVSRHLKILKEAGILTAKKEGRSTYYALNAEMLATSLRAIADALTLCQKDAQQAASQQ